MWIFLVEFTMWKTRRMFLYLSSKNFLPYLYNHYIFSYRTYTKRQTNNKRCHVWMGKEYMYQVFTARNGKRLRRVCYELWVSSRHECLDFVYFQNFIWWSKGRNKVMRWRVYLPIGGSKFVSPHIPDFSLSGILRIHRRLLKSW